MKKTIATIAATGALLLYAATVFAAGGPTYDKNNQGGANGQSNNGTYYFVEKDSSWEIVTRDESGAYGTGKYNLSGEDLTMKYNLHGLEPNRDYQVEVWSYAGGWGTLEYFAANCPGGKSIDDPAITTDNEGSYAGSLMLPGLASGDYIAVVKTDDCPAAYTGSNYQYVLYEFLPFHFENE